MARQFLHEPLHQHTRDYWDEYRARLNVLRSRHPNLDARELHYRSLPTVEAPPSKPAPEPPKPRTKAQIIWPYLASSEEK
jgi:hypothetical protein